MIERMTRERSSLMCSITVICRSCRPVRLASVDPAAPHGASRSLAPGRPWLAWRNSVTVCPKVPHDLLQTFGTENQQGDGGEQYQVAYIETGHRALLLLLLRCLRRPLAVIVIRGSISRLMHRFREVAGSVLELGDRLAQRTAQLR